MVARGSMHVSPDSGWSWIICCGNSLALFSSLGIYRCFGVFYDSVMFEFDAKYAQVSLVSGFFTGAMSFGGTRKISSAFFIPVLQPFNDLNSALYSTVSYRCEMAWTQKSRIGVNFPFQPVFIYRLSKQQY